VGILLAAGTVAFQKSGSLLVLLMNMGLLFGLLILGVGSFVAVFVLWKKHHLRALVPLGSFAGAVLIFVFGGRYGTDIVLRRSPARPDSFFQGQTRKDLTQIAERLVGNGFKEIVTFPSEPTKVHMIAGHPVEDVPPDIQATLRRYGFQMTYVDNRCNIVEFSCSHLRTWHDYIWSKSGLSEPDSMPATITDVDIEDWEELIRIANQGTTCSGGVSFYPNIVYPYLNEVLGEKMLDRVKGYRSADEISDEEKNLVLSALNKHRLASSGLAEYPEITYEQSSGLHIGNCSLHGDFWVVALLKRLLSEGVLTPAPDCQHLKIKPNLTDKERLQVEWFHVRLMNFIYRNLLEKRQYPFERDLGSNWYYYRS
jgi:hypothetical protein